MIFFKDGSSKSESVLLKFDDINEILTITYSDETVHNYKAIDCTIKKVGRYHWIHLPHGYVQIESDQNPWIHAVKGKTIDQKKNIKLIVGYLFIFALIVIGFMYEDALSKYLPPSVEENLYKRVIFIFQYDEQKLYQTEQTKKIEKIFADYDSDLKDVSIYIYPEKQINAVALPGKKIFIYEELIQKCESYDELIGIIAHEMGHVKHRHIVKNVVKAIASDFLSYFMTGTDFGIGLYMLSYSRKNEQEADAYAAQFLKEQKYSLSGIIDFFARHSKENFSFLSTHPAPQDRTAYFKKESLK